MRKIIKMMKMKMSINILNPKNTILNMEINLIDMKIKIKNQNMKINSMMSQRKMKTKNIIQKITEIIKNLKSQ
jgi:hypothetical protein